MNGFKISGRPAASINGYCMLVDASLSITQDRIKVWTSGTVKLNPAWTFTDDAGHFHAVSDEGEPLPTLWRKTTPCDDPGHDEECDGGPVYYVCRVCGETVEPGWIIDTPPGVTFEPGLISWTLTVALASDDQPTEFTRSGQWVSVRVAWPEVEYFGVGSITSIRQTPCRTSVIEVTGSGPLGTRKP